MKMSSQPALKENHLSEIKGVDSDEVYNKRLISVFIDGLKDRRFDQEQIPDMLYSLYRGPESDREKIAANFIRAGRVAGICSGVLKSIPFYNFAAM
jgi:hypothetical protein